MTPLSGRPPGHRAAARLLVSGDEVFVLDTGSGGRTPVGRCVPPATQGRW
ncbi:hypothetical protein [Nonomuraea soli]|uniref:Uncharacterized protein n=1 Tax=Nonomuraea soli TaxID=1032476 RepID=A0A7W0CEA7_9ACTN|nr:hypothetical protein [Nonomuraea soli]MBA2889581.1 hypothetical protein [Nonomuraea soli]